MEKKISTTEHVSKYSDAIKGARDVNLDAFHNWFNKSGSSHESVVRGFWDFTCHILTPAVCQLVMRPEDKVCLEIGYGGGRILNAATHYFKEAIGIDIHNEAEYVSTFLKQLKRDNFRLIRSNGEEIPVSSGEVDFVYSFIVLQHLPRFDVFQSYLKETYRCLKPGGVAQLYFGAWSILPLKDRILNFTQGYKELPDVKVNHTSLVIRREKVKSLCRSLNFTVIDTGYSYKQAPDGYKDNRGGQYCITLLK